MHYSEAAKDMQVRRTKSRLRNATRDDDVTDLRITQLISYSILAFPALKKIKPGLPTLGESFNVLKLNNGKTFNILKKL